LILVAIERNVKLMTIDRLVSLDLNKLEALAKDRGLAIHELMSLLGIKRLAAKVPSELKIKIWQLLERKDLPLLLAEIRRKFPEATVGEVEMVPGPRVE